MFAYALDVDKKLVLASAEAVSKGSRAPGPPLIWILASDFKGVSVFEWPWFVLRVPNGRDQCFGFRRA